jgi:methylenetetrahydrofolate reductase (NADPH)
MDLKDKFADNEFILLAEMEPPKGADVSQMLKNANRIKGMLDAFMVPEMTNAVMRMSSLGGAMILRSHGLPAIMQANCRDRNRLALQADLLAAHASGIQTVMIVKGEDPSYGDHHQARAVYDIDQYELLAAIKQMQRGRDMAGVDLLGPPEFLVGTTCDFGAVGKSPEMEVEDVLRKAEGGARFFITPPLFDLSALTPYMKKVDFPQIKIIPTVLLLKSLGMARYMARNVSQIYLPDEIIKRIQSAGDKVRECVKIAAETVSRLKAEGFAGVMLSTMGWENRLPDIIERIE